MPSARSPPPPPLITPSHVYEIVLWWIVKYIVVISFPEFESRVIHCSGTLVTLSQVIRSICELSAEISKWNGETRNPAPRFTSPRRSSCLEHVILWSFGYFSIRSKFRYVKSDLWWGNLLLFYIILWAIVLTLKSLHKEFFVLVSFAREKSEPCIFPIKPNNNKSIWSVRHLRPLKKSPTPYRSDFVS